MTIAVLAAVAGGSALGGSLRHLCAEAAHALGLALPWATLAVNLTGSLGIALFAAALTALGRDRSPALRHFVMTGVMGGFTTFSLMSLDMLALLAGGRTPVALAYLGASVGGAVLAAWGGALAGERLGHALTRRTANRRTGGA